MMRANPDGSARGLARGAALLLALDAVVHGIPHQVKEGIRDLLDDRVVHLDGLSGELEIDALSPHSRGLAGGLEEP